MTMTAKQRARGMLPYAIAFCAAIAIWALWPDQARGAAPPIGPAPAPHPSCGDAPLLVLNEDTGQLFAAVSVTYEWADGLRLLRFRDGRILCDGYEGN